MMTEKRVLKKTKIFDQNKRNKMESIIDKSKTNEKRIDKIASTMKIAKSSLESARMFAMIYEKASSKKLLKILRKKRLRKTRHHRKQ